MIWRSGIIAPSSILQPMITRASAKEIVSFRWARSLTTIQLQSLAVRLWEVFRYALIASSVRWASSIVAASR